MLKLANQAVNIASKLYQDSKEEISKMITFQNLSKFVANYIYGSYVDNQLDLEVIQIYAKDILEYTFDYIRLPKEYIDTLDIDKDIEVQPQIIHFFVDMISNKPNFDFLMKSSHIELRLNAEKTFKLIKDIRIFSLDKLNRSSDYNLGEIYDKIESEIPNDIDAKE